MAAPVAKAVAPFSKNARRDEAPSERRRNKELVRPRPLALDLLVPTVLRICPPKRISFASPKNAAEKSIILGKNLSLPAKRRSSTQLNRNQHVETNERERAIRTDRVHQRRTNVEVTDASTGRALEVSPSMIGCHWYLWASLPCDQAVACPAERAAIARANFMVKETQQTPHSAGI